MKRSMERYRDVFLIEARQHVALMNNSMLALEKDPGESGGMADLLRAAHSLKSMASTMDLDGTAALCHRMEDVFDAIERHDVTISACSDTLFSCFDALERSLNRISESHAEIDTGEMITRLDRLIAGVSSPPSGDRGAGRADRGQPLVIPPVETIAVKVDRLDALMNLAEELLVNKMRLDRIEEGLQNPVLTDAMDTMGRLLDDVQYNVMQVRMIPVGFVFSRFPRMVRDLAREQGKDVEIELSGVDMKLDRTLVDGIAEPLVHILRNAVDHGIEPPGERARRGKPRKGTIRLSAERMKGLATIEIEDDGRGIDWDAVRRIGATQGALPDGEPDPRPGAALFSGISTSEAITPVSGRGFGLNIAKNKIESLGGTVEVQSEPLAYTKFVVRIPLTLAVTKSLFVDVGDKSFAIPLTSVERLIHIDQADIRGAFDTEVIVINQEEVPVARLGRVLDIPSHAPGRLPVVIVMRGDERLGLIVDGFRDIHEVVIKPLSNLMSSNEYFAGCSILGSGEVVLILDVGNLIMSTRTPT